MFHPGRISCTPAPLVAARFAGRGRRLLTPASSSATAAAFGDGRGAGEAPPAAPPQPQAAVVPRRLLGLLGVLQPLHLHHDGDRRWPSRRSPGGPAAGRPFRSALLGLTGGTCAARCCDRRRWAARVGAGRRRATRPSVVVSSQSISCPPAPCSAVPPYWVASSLPPFALLAVHGPLHRAARGRQAAYAWPVCWNTQKSQIACPRGGPRCPRSAGESHMRGSVTRS